MTPETRSRLEQMIDAGIAGVMATTPPSERQVVRDSMNFLRSRLSKSLSSLEPPQEEPGSDGLFHDRIGPASGKLLDSKAVRPQEEPTGRNSLSADRERIEARLTAMEEALGRIDQDDVSEDVWNQICAALTEQGQETPNLAIADASGAEMTNQERIDALKWSIARVENLQQCHEINAGRFGLKLLKGHGYPDEAMSDAQDALALRAVLSQLSALAAALTAARKERDAAHAHACEASLEERDLRLALTACQQERDYGKKRIASDADLLKGLHSALTACRAQGEAMRAALKALRIDANRLCDRNQGGSYEDDCRRSIARADAALSSTPTEPKNES